MATLTRVQPSSVLNATIPEGEILLDSCVPEPFPVDILRDRRQREVGTVVFGESVDEESLLEVLAGENLELDPFDDNADVGVDEDPQLVRPTFSSSIIRC